MAAPALAPTGFAAGVPRTSLTQFIEVDDWAPEEPESNLKRMERKVIRFVARHQEGGTREGLATITRLFEEYNSYILGGNNGY